MLRVLAVGFTSSEVEEWIQPHLGSDIIVERPGGDDRLLLVVIGDHLVDPVREAAEWGFGRPAAHVVLAAPAGKTDLLRAQLLTTPFLPHALEVVATDDPLWFQHVVGRIQRAVQTQERLDQANAFLRRTLELV